MVMVHQRAGAGHSLVFRLKYPLLGPSGLNEKGTPHGWLAVRTSLPVRLNLPGEAMIDLLHPGSRQGAAAIGYHKKMFQSNQTLGDLGNMRIVPECNMQE